MKHRNLFWGIFLVLAGVLIVAFQFGSFASIGLWSILASVLLVAILVESLVHLNFTGITVPLALLYAIYQRPFDWLYISPWILVLSSLFVGIGLSMLFRRRPRWHAAPPPYQQPTYPTNQGARPAPQTEDNADDNHPFSRISFGAMSKYLHSSSLEYGQFGASFGTLEVYFDQVTLAPDGAVLYLDCSFGSIKLFVPRGWKVVDDMNATMGGVSKDDRFTAPAADAPLLTLTGNVTMGGIEVHYV